MKILVLENEPSSARGGQEVSLFDVCRSLAARGHQIELLYTREGDLLAGYHEFCARIDRVAAYSIDRSRTARAALRLAIDAVQADRTAPDVIYANQYMDGLFARLLSWRFLRPCVCHLRLPPPDHFCVQYRWGLRGVTRFIANSERVRQDYIASGLPSERIDMVYNGIDVGAWKPAGTLLDARRQLDVPLDTYLCVFAGRLHPDKGLETAVEALAMLRAPSDLLLAGKELDDGSGRHYRAELEALASRLGVTDRCHFVGQVSRIAAIFTAADVTVLPSRRESFGRVLIESMACGTPAVASRAGGIPEVLAGEFDAFLVPPDDPSALAERLEQLRGWRAHDPGLAARCREHVGRRFGLDQSVLGVEAALRRSIAEWRGDASAAATAARVG